MTLKLVGVCSNEADECVIFTIPTNNVNVSI
jgi:hypothetical protein